MNKKKTSDSLGFAQRQVYLARINRVMDYVSLHLDEELSLARLAGIADFSVYHFHRIFRAVTGEALFQFIQRLRLEKAASLLCANREKSITEIALDCGFSGSASFARAFRTAFSMTAGEWRRRHDSKIGKYDGNSGQVVGKQRKDTVITFHYSKANHMFWRLEMHEGKTKAQVEIRELKEMNVAYVRHIGPYKNDAQLFRTLFTRLMVWAGSKSLLDFPRTQVMAVYHDDPAITDENRQRVSCCITVPPGTEVDGDIGLMTLAGGKYAMARFELAVGEYEDAWNTVFGAWLPESGWQCDDRPCFELYHNNCDEHPQQKSIVDICIPVRPM